MQRRSAYTQERASDGVVSVVAHAIRRISGLVQYDASQQPVQSFRADIVPDPIPPDNPAGLPPNPAHAVIQTDPFPPPRGVYRRLLESLALIVTARGWEIRPQELRRSSNEQG